MARPELFQIGEVMIESKRDGDTEVIHDDFACAVGETPTLIVELLKRVPRKRQISGSYLVYFCETITKELRAKQQCALSFATSSSK